MSTIVERLSHPEATRILQLLLLTMMVVWRYVMEMEPVSRGPIRMRHNYVQLITEISQQLLHKRIPKVSGPSICRGNAQYRSRWCLQ